jgi:hypothetical protein
MDMNGMLDSMLTMGFEDKDPKKVIPNPAMREFYLECFSQIMPSIRDDPKAQEEMISSLYKVTSCDGNEDGGLKENEAARGLRCKSCGTTFN